MAKRSFKKNARYYRIDLYVDIETFEVSNPEEGEPRIKPYHIGCVSCLDLILNHRIKDEVRCYRNFEDFLEYLKYLNTLTNDLTLGSHNAKYDFTATAYEFEKHLGTKCIDAQFTERGEIISIVINHPELRFEGRCTLKGDPRVGGLKGIIHRHFPELITEEVPHGKRDARGIDNYLFYTDENGYLCFVESSLEEDYLRSDVSAVALYHRLMVVGCVSDIGYALKLKREDERFVKSAKTLSVGGLAKQLMFSYLEQKHEYLGVNDVFLPLNRIGDCYDPLKRGNCGGFVSFNKYVGEYECKPGELVVTFDITAFYPSLLKGHVPIIGRAPKELIESRKEDGFVPMSWVEYVLPTTIEWKDEMDYLGQPPITFSKGGQSIIIPEDGAKDLDSYLKDKGVVVRQFYTPAVEVFADVVNKLYHHRMKNKGTNLELTIKAVMNSMYGKSSESPRNIYCRYCKREGDNAFKFYRIKTQQEGGNYTFIGTYIASEGRRRLIEAINNEVANGNTFLCCDTDSITLVVRNKPKFELGEGLGKGRMVFVGNKFKGAKKCKRYMVVNELGEEVTKGTVLEGVKVQEERRKAVGGGIPNAQALFPDLDDETLSHIIGSDKNVVIRNFRKRSFVVDGQIVIKLEDFETDPELGEPSGELFYDSEVDEFIYKDL